MQAAYDDPIVFFSGKTPSLLIPTFTKTHAGQHPHACGRAPTKRFGQRFTELGARAGKRIQRRRVAKLTLGQLGP
jgi:hypothetical protein